jgi:hypothetical protein
MGSREKGWEEHTVASLDSALNSWFDSLPDHRGSTLDGALLHAYQSLFSALGPPTGESNLLHSISCIARCLLLYSNHDPSPVHTNFPEGEFLVFPCIRNLCECCSCFQPCWRCSPEEVPDRYHAKYYRAYILIGSHTFTEVMGGCVAPHIHFRRHFNLEHVGCEETWHLL